MAAGAFLLGDIHDIRAFLIDSFGRSGEVDRMGQEMVSPSEGGTSTAGGQRRAVPRKMAG